MTQDAAQPRKGTGSTVAGWPLGRKMAMALTIPLLLAAVLGGLRVSGDLGDSRQAATSARQVTIIQPAIDYLTSSEAAMVAAAARAQGVLVGQVSSHRIRMVTHLDVDRAGVERAAKVVAEVLAR